MESQLASACPPNPAGSCWAWGGRSLPLSPQSAGKSCSHQPGHLTVEFNQLRPTGFNFDFSPKKQNEDRGGNKVLRDFFILIGKLTKKGYQSPDNQSRALCDKATFSSPFLGEAPEGSFPGSPITQTSSHCGKERADTSSPLKVQINHLHFNALCSSNTTARQPGLTRTTTMDAETTGIEK